MQFKDIIGQEEVKNHLRRSVQQGRIPHAQLFTGAPGVGKLPLALAYAQYVNCPNRTDEDSCGTCPTCVQFGRLQHPDLHFVFPIVKPESAGSKEIYCSDYLKTWREQLLDQPYFDQAMWNSRLGQEKKQGKIYDSEAGEIMRKLTLKAYGAKFKTMIIWLPEKMGELSSNKLLKLLEEPPQDTLFLLVTESPQQLLPTVLSRVQEMAVPVLEEKDIASYLHHELDFDISDATTYAHMAEGSVVRAKRLAAGDELLQAHLGQFQTIMRLAWRVAERQEYNALLEMRDWAAEQAKIGRERQKEFLQYCLKQTRENFIQNYVPESIIYQTPDESNFSVRFARFIHAGNVEPIMQQFALAERQIEQNGNANIIFFDLAMQLTALIKKK